MNSVTEQEQIDMEMVVGIEATSELMRAVEEYAIMRNPNAAVGLARRVGAKFGQQYARLLLRYYDQMVREYHINSLG